MKKYSKIYWLKDPKKNLTRSVLGRIFTLLLHKIARRPLRGVRPPGALQEPSEVLPGVPAGCATPASDLCGVLRYYELPDGIYSEV